MKGFIILTAAALLSSQAFAAKLVCINSLGEHIVPEADSKEQIDRPDVVDYLEVVGLLDSEGFLEVRRDTPTMATLVSKPNFVDICQGVNVTEKPEEAGGSPDKGWRKSKLYSQAFRIKLTRNQDTGEILAEAALQDTKVTFRNCSLIAEEGDQEQLKAIWDETHDPELDRQMEEDKNRKPPEGSVTNQIINTVIKAIQ